VRLYLWILLLLCWPALAEEAGEVRVGSRVVFVLEAPVGSITARERADILNRRIEQILADPELNPAEIGVREGSRGGTLIQLHELPILAVSRFDAELNQTDPAALAEHWAELLRSRINQVKPLYASRPQIEIKTLSEHHILLMIVQVTSLLLSARLFGALAVRLGQPAVIGQLVAGIVLGRSVLGSLFPGLQALVFPVEATQAYLLEVFSWLGVILLLMLTGLETDLPMMRRQGRAAGWAVAMGVLLPFALGAGVGLAVPDRLLVEPESRLVLALFLGTALSVSSVPVVARILAEMGVLRRSLGQLILTAALGHDTLGWLMLALVAGMASHGAVDMGNLLRTMLGTLGFIIFSLTLGRRLVYGGLRRLARSGQDPEGAVLTAMIVVTLVSAGVTHVIGVHAVLGAFVAGVILSGSAVVDEKVVHPIESVTMALFAPIFFAAAGLHVNLWGIFRPELFPYALLLTAAATAGKVGAGFLAGRLAGLDSASSWALGVGTNARGAMGLILGILGFSLGLVTVDMFTMLIVMALVTTAMTPPLLTWLLRHVPVSAEEKARLEHEEWRASSALARVRSVLLPLGGGAARSDGRGVGGRPGAHPARRGRSFGGPDRPESSRRGPGAGSGHGGFSRGSRASAHSHRAGPVGPGGAAAGSRPCGPAERGRGSRNLGAILFQPAGGSARAGFAPARAGRAGGAPGQRRGANPAGRAGGPSRWPGHRGFRGAGPGPRGAADRAQSRGGPSRQLHLAPRAGRGDGGARPRAGRPGRVARPGL